MDLIKAIPIGKQHKISRKELMKKANIRSVRHFTEELSFLRKRYIILFDDGYYLPSSKEEYMEFINKTNEIIKNAKKTVKLAYDEMEELGNV